MTPWLISMMESPAIARHHHLRHFTQSVFGPQHVGFFVMMSSRLLGHGIPPLWTCGIGLVGGGSGGTGSAGGMGFGCGFGGCGIDVIPRRPHHRPSGEIPPGAAVLRRPRG
jgi:hypothetical protein